MVTTAYKISGQVEIFPKSPDQNDALKLILTILAPETIF